MWGRREGRNGDKKEDTLAYQNAAFSRTASHAGSWYSSNASELERQLCDWLAASGVRQQAAVRAVIAPHAGYRYSGRCAAYAFGHIDPSTVSRVFLLGPSHHFFTRRCLLTALRAYCTPLGDIQIDTDVVEELRGTGEFGEMSKEVDEAEHSLELHLPYIQHCMQGRPFKLVPIVVGALTPSTEAIYGKLLAPYLLDPTNFFSISSDFCHWGSRFSFTPYDRGSGLAIHECIEALDREGMSAIESGSCKAFTAYLRRTENTICGRHPISVLLSMLEHCPSRNFRLSFVHYEQSGRCASARDSSVSYASGIAVLEGQLPGRANGVEEEAVPPHPHLSSHGSS